MREMRSADDRILTERLLAALSSLELADMRAVVRDGIAYLSGPVPSDLDRARARQAARTVPGVTDVVDDITIDSDSTVAPGGEPIDLAGTADYDVPGSSMLTGTEDDLNGDIGTTDPAEAADGSEPYYPPTDPVVRPVPRSKGDIEITGGFSAGSLDSPLESEPGPPRLQGGDDEIARDVRLALREDAGTSDLRIRVVVRDGVVYLRGTVGSLDDVELAEAVAGQVDGVLEVQEELEIEGM